MLTENLAKAIDAIVPVGVTHIGFIATNQFGDYLLTEPPGHPYGVSMTFSKIKANSGESSSRTLQRCLEQQIGKKPESIYPIPSTWVTPNSVGYYFAGMLGCKYESPSEIPHIQWYSKETARNRLKSSQNPVSRQRDLALLNCAEAMCLSPCRRILLMVQELHKMGFERLRAPAYEYPLAWRCPIVPSSWVLARDGRDYDDPTVGDKYLCSLLGKKIDWGYRMYSSAMQQEPFDWQCMHFASPRELASRFVKEQPEICFAGWGPDPQYTQWFNETLDRLKPNGIYHSADCSYGPDTLEYSTEFSKVEKISAPPRGYAEKDEFTNFKSHIQRQNSENSPE